MCPRSRPGRKRCRQKPSPEGGRLILPWGWGHGMVLIPIPKGWAEAGGTLTEQIFKSIFSSPEPKPHPHGSVRQTEGTPVWQRDSGQGRWSLSLTHPSPHWAQNPLKSHTGILHMLEQFPCKASSGSAPASPYHATPLSQLHSKAPPGPVCAKVNWKSPFPHHLGFSFHSANWSIIHLLWQSSALGTKLSGGLDFMPPQPQQEGRY